MGHRAPNTSLTHGLVGLIACGLVLTLAASARAQDDGQQSASSMWASLDAGGGPMHRTVFGYADRAPQGYAGFTIGKVLDPHLLVGLSFGYRAVFNFTDEWTPGDVNQSFMGIARIYPTKLSGLHLRLGGGTVCVGDSSWEDLYLGRFRFAGAWEAGVGYDIRGKSVHVTPFVTYSRALAGSEVEWRAVTVGVSLTFRDR